MTEELQTQHQPRLCLHYLVFGERKGCEKGYIPTRSDQKHCSGSCRDIFNQKIKRFNNTQKECLHHQVFGQRRDEKCLVFFNPQRKDAKHCNRTCKDIYNRKVRELKAKEKQHGKT